MTTILSRLWNALSGDPSYVGDGLFDETGEAQQGNMPILVTLDDPIVEYFKNRPAVTAVEQIELDSEALHELKKAGVRLVAPLVCRGELVGLLNLSGRRGTGEYSPDDFLLLNGLITQAAPALRAAQLAELQKAAALKSLQLEQELRVARLIQHTLLPKELPQMPGWKVAAHYQPARAVGGDFYDFVSFPDGRMAFIIGDVTDKGMPAALLMATTRATLRAFAQRFVQPGEVLETTNEMITPDVPPSMFVTCLYALLEPKTGRMVYANAGHNLPYRFRGQQVSELHATGMPLGMLPGMQYEEYETTLEPGENLLLYSDGLVEAHNPVRELFGNPRMEDILRHSTQHGQHLFRVLLDELLRFTGAAWEQEDDITMVLLERQYDEGKAQ